MCGRDGLKLDISGRGEDEDVEGGKEWDGSEMGDGEAVQGGDRLLKWVGDGGEGGRLLGTTGSC